MSNENIFETDNVKPKQIENINFFLSHLEEDALQVVLATAKELAKSSESYRKWWAEANSINYNLTS